MTETTILVAVIGGAIASLVGALFGIRQAVTGERSRVVIERLSREAASERAPLSPVIPESTAQNVTNEKLGV